MKHSWATKPSALLSGTDGNSPAWSGDHAEVRGGGGDGQNTPTFLPGLSLLCFRGADHQGEEGEST